MGSPSKVITVLAWEYRTGWNMPSESRGYPLPGTRIPAVHTSLDLVKRQIRLPTNFEFWKIWWYPKLDIAGTFWRRAKM